MKRLKLKALDLGADEVLSRDELKGITGGIFGTCFCTCPDGVTYTTIGPPSCSAAANDPAECGTGNVATCTWGGSILG